MQTKKEAATASGIIIYDWAFCQLQYGSNLTRDTKCGNLCNQGQKRERKKASRLRQPVNKFSQQLSHFIPWLCEHNTNGFVFVCLFIQFIALRVSTASSLALWVVVLFRQKLNVQHWVCVCVYIWLRIVDKHNHFRFICAIALYRTV